MLFNALRYTEGMKPRHAAALALVGWYLIAPPIRTPKTGEPYLDVHAPYRDWQILHEFKTVDDCEDDAGGFVDGDVDPQLLLDQRSEAECIATDDPRLKSK